MMVGKSTKPVRSAAENCSTSHMWAELTPRGAAVQGCRRWAMGKLR